MTALDYIALVTATVEPGSASPVTRTAAERALKACGLTRKNGSDKWVLYEDLTYSLSAVLFVNTDGTLAPVVIDLMGKKWFTCRTVADIQRLPEILKTARSILKKFVLDPRYGNDSAYMHGMPGMLETLMKIPGIKNESSLFPTKIEKYDLDWLRAYMLTKHVTATVEPKRSHSAQITEEFYRAVSAYARTHSMTVERMPELRKASDSYVHAYEILKDHTVIGDIALYMYNDINADISTYAFKAHGTNRFQLIKKDGNYHQTLTVNDFRKKLQDFLSTLKFPAIG